MPKRTPPDHQIADRLRELRAYTRTTLNRDVRIGQVHSIAEPQIASRYHVVGVSIGGEPSVLALLFGSATPDEIAGDLNIIERALGRHAIHVQSAITSADRSRLIQRGLSFIVPGSQLHIPPLAVSLRESYQRPVTVYKGGLAPVSQAVLFHLILMDAGETTGSLVAAALGYTPMSAGRALDELAVHDIGRFERRGREKVFCLADRDAAIEHASPFLHSPARGAHGARFLGRRPKMLQAGETALAALTNTQTDSLPTFAIYSPDRASFFEQHKIESLWDTDGADAIIETWRYDPAILSKGPCVDPLSLYAHYTRDKDPRLAGAAKKLLSMVLA